MSEWMMSRRIGLTPENTFKQAVAPQNRGDLRGAEKIYRAPELPDRDEEALDRAQRSIALNPKHQDAMSWIPLTARTPEQVEEETVQPHPVATRQ